MYAVLVVWGSKSLALWVGLATGPGNAVDFVDRAWRVRLPATEPVLAALGIDHPDKAVAKAARKSLFKYRSAH